jgi:hypothetical protein
MKNQIKRYEDSYTGKEIERFVNWKFCILDILYPERSVTGSLVNQRLVTGRYVTESSVTRRFVGVP